MWGCELTNWCGCGAVSLWVCEFASWLVDELIGWWVCEVVRLWVEQFVSWAVCELNGLWVKWLMSWIVDGFLRLQFDEFIPLHVAGFSRVHQPTSWFALHFIHKRSVYLVLEHKGNKPLPIYRNIKCLAGFYVKPQHIYLFSTTRCVILFLYIKPQRLVPAVMRERRCIISFLYIKPQLADENAVLAQSCIISSLYIKPQPWPSCPWACRVVLYRFSTSNHNQSALHCSCTELYYIVSLHQATTAPHLHLISFLLYYIVSLHQTTTLPCNTIANVLLYYIVSLHQTTTNHKKFV